MPQILTTKEMFKDQGLDSFNNLVSDTVMAEPRSQFQDYPGDKNLGSVQDQNLEDVRDNYDLKWIRRRRGCSI
jgi:hypothetical protein